MKAFVLLAAVSAAQAAPQWVLPYAAHAVVTGNSVPVSVGGYKAVAGSNGDLAGPVHEVPGLVPALAVHKQESSGEVSLSTGTGAVLPTLAYHGLVYGKRSADAEPEADADAYYGYYGYPYGYRAYGYGYGYPYRYYGKRSAEADPQVLTYGAGVLSYPYAAYPYVVPAVKPLEIKSEVVATGAAVPVAVGGYKAVAGDNGDLKGAVHEVPAIFGAPALDTQENSNGGSLTVGTSAVVNYSIAKRSAEAEADPAVLYSASRVLTAPTPLIHNAPALAYAAYPHAYAPYAYYG